MSALRCLQPEPLVQIHPQTALETGISPGDKVRISSPFGHCFMTADVSDRFKPDVIHCDYGWWFPEEEGAEPHLFGVNRANINALFPSDLQGPGGFGYPFRGFICNIEKVKE
jgi:anaerobic selenocysteine-containing dehydrogenase